MSSKWTNYGAEQHEECRLELRRETLPEELKRGDTVTVLTGADVTELQKLRRELDSLVWKLKYAPNSKQDMLVNDEMYEVNNKISAILNPEAK